MLIDGSFSVLFASNNKEDEFKEELIVKLDTDGRMEGGDSFVGAGWR